MTAQPIESPAGDMWSPDPIRQRPANHTLDDVVALPEDAPRVELRDGVMIVVSSPSLGHQTIGNPLWRWLYETAPDTYQPATALGVAVAAYTTFEQDPVPVFADEPVDGDHRLVADATDERVLDRPFEIRLPIRDITP